MRDPNLFLQEMLESCQKVQKYTLGFSHDDFVEDALVIDAVVRNLEIIGEAARQVPETLREAHPEIPWKRIIGFRHVAVHGYFVVDVETVWTIVTQRVPELIRQLEPLVALEDVDSQ